MSVLDPLPNALVNTLLHDSFVLIEQGVATGINDAMRLPLDFVRLYRQSPEWDKQVARMNDKRQLWIEGLNRLSTLITLISKRL